MSVFLTPKKNEDLAHECDIEVKGFTALGKPIHRGILTKGMALTPIYVRGDKVKIVPLWKRSLSLGIDASANSKSNSKEGRGSRDNHAHFALSSKEEDGDGTSSTARTKDGIEAKAPEKVGLLLDVDAMPDADADAKLERLPSNTPVLRPWGEVAGVERRWRSAADGNFDMERMALAGASYVSNTATIEVGDSDADSKDGSSNSAVSSGGERPPWTRNSNLSEVVASGLPMLSAMSSESSEVVRGNAMELRAMQAVQDIDGGSGSSGGTGDRAAHGEGLVTSGRDQRADSEGGAALGVSRNVDRGGGATISAGVDTIVDGVRSERASTSSSRPRACAGAKDVADEAHRSEEGEEAEAKLSPTWKWAVKVRAAAMPRKARLRLYLQRRISLPSPGPSLEEAREWMMAWTPEMDSSLMDLLHSNEAKVVSSSYKSTFKQRGLFDDVVEMACANDTHCHCFAP